MSFSRDKLKSSKRNLANDGEEILAILGPGDFFGEGALLDSGARSASIRARSNVEVTVLGRNVFTQISSCLAPFFFFLRDAVANAMKRRTKHLEEFAGSQRDSRGYSTFVPHRAFDAPAAETNRCCGVRNRTD